MNKYFANKEKSIGKNVIYNAIKVLSSMIFPLISFPYASRILGPEGIGRVDFSNSVVAYFVLLSSMGIGTYAIREGAKIRNDKEKINCFIAEIFSINLCTTIGSYVLFLLTIHYVSKFETYRNTLLICSCLIVFSTLGLDWIYSIYEEYAYMAIRSAVFQVIAMIILFILVKTERDYDKYAVVIIFASVGSNILNLVNSRKIVDWTKFKFSPNLKRHWKAIMLIFGLNLACNIYMNLDKTMLGIICGDTAVGLYTAALKINQAILSIILSVGTVSMARLSFYLESGKKKEFDDLLKLIFNVVLMLSLPICIGIGICGEIFLLILNGDKYMEAKLAIKILALIVPIIGCSNILSVQVFIPMRKEKYSLAASGGAAIVNLGLNSILIPKYSYVGAAISTVIAELTALIIVLYISRKLIPKVNLFQYINSYFKGSLIIIPIAWWIKRLNLSDRYLSFVLIIFISMICYIFYLLFVKNPYVLFIIKKAQQLLIKDKKNG